MTQKTPQKACFLGVTYPLGGGPGSSSAGHKFVPPYTLSPSFIKIGWVIRAQIRSQTDRHTDKPVG